MLGAPVFRTALFGPWSGNALWTAARAVPSLDLCFADKKDLICASSGRQLVTFTRASSGTYVDSAGVLQTAATDVPRFDHNPLTGESLGLLVEEQRTNLCLYSQAISTLVPWGANSIETCVASTLVDPAGGTSASKINLDASTASRWQQPITVVNGTTYTLSAWVRSTTGTTLFRLRFGGGITSPDLTATTTWQRFTYTLTAGTTAGFFAFNAPSTGAATEIHVYGAQLEAGATASSYIPTTTAAATRNADVVSITGTNFSSWYRQDEGTFYSDSSILRSQIKTQVVWSAEGGTFSTSLRQPQGTANQFRAVVNNVFTASTGANLTDGATRAAVAYSGVQGRLQVGIAGADATGAGTSDAITLSIGSAGGGTQLNGHIRRLVFWPQALPGQLQAITQP